jgi:hypothetical protein
MLSNVVVAIRYLTFRSNKEPFADFRETPLSKQTKTRYLIQNQFGIVDMTDCEIVRAFHGFFVTQIERETL